MLRYRDIILIHFLIWAILFNSPFHLISLWMTISNGCSMLQKSFLGDWLVIYGWLYLLKLSIGCVWILNVMALYI